MIYRNSPQYVVLVAICIFSGVVEWCKGVEIDVQKQLSLEPTEQNSTLRDLEESTEWHRRRLRQVSRARDQDELLNPMGYLDDLYRDLDEDGRRSIWMDDLAALADPPQIPLKFREKVQNCHGEFNISKIVDLVNEDKRQRICSAAGSSCCCMRSGEMPSMTDLILQQQSAPSTSGAGVGATAGANAGAGAGAGAAVASNAAVAPKSPSAAVVAPPIQAVNLAPAVRLKTSTEQSFKATEQVKVTDRMKVAAPPSAASKRPDDAARRKLGPPHRTSLAPKFRSHPQPKEAASLAPPTKLN